MNLHAGDAHVATATDVGAGVAHVAVLLVQHADQRLGGLHAELVHRDLPDAVRRDLHPVLEPVQVLRRVVLTGGVADQVYGVTFLHKFGAGHKDGCEVAESNHSSINNQSHIYYAPIHHQSLYITYQYIIDDHTYSSRFIHQSSSISNHSLSVFIDHRYSEFV